MAKLDLKTPQRLILREFMLFAVGAHEVLEGSEIGLLEIFAVVCENEEKINYSLAVAIDNHNETKTLVPLTAPDLSELDKNSEQYFAALSAMYTIQSLEANALASLRRIQAISARIGGAKIPVGLRMMGAPADKNFDGVLLYPADDLKMSALAWANALYEVE